MYVTINGWNDELLFVSTLPVHALKKLKKTQGAFANNDSAAGLAFAFFSASSAEAIWQDSLQRLA